MKVVLANGCFDILHWGHVAHLQEARKMGDYLIVSVTMDENVNKGPGRPINPLWKRMAVLKELRCVSQVYPTLSACSAILHWKPQIFVKGIDYAAGNAFTEDVVAACKKVRAELRFTFTPKMSVTEDIIAKTRAIA